jgi:transposase-like protein
MTARRELYGIAEIADALGQSRQLVTVWRRRRTRGMPEPDAELSSGPVWRGLTIEPWIDDQVRLAGRGAVPAPLRPATVRKAGRRLLRLVALLLEDARRPRLVEQASREAADLLPEIEAAERTPTAVTLLKAMAPLAAPEEDPDALLAALVERLPALAEVLGASLTEAEPATGD